jgi:hypothetical protein
MVAHKANYAPSCVEERLDATTVTPAGKETIARYEIVMPDP